MTLDQEFTAHCPLTKTVWQYGWLFIDTVEAKRIYLRGFFKNRGWTRWHSHQKWMWILFSASTGYFCLTGVKWYLIVVIIVLISIVDDKFVIIVLTISFSYINCPSIYFHWGIVYSPCLSSFFNENVFYVVTLYDHLINPIHFLFVRSRVFSTC